jgi:hypothetical protein
LLGCDIMYFGGGVEKFRRNLLPPSSGCPDGWKTADLPKFLYLFTKVHDIRHHKTLGPQYRPDTTVRILNLTYFSQ